MEITDGKPYMNQIRERIMEYAQWLGRDLSFQDLEKELEDPAKKYTAPEGEILAAVEDGKVYGIVAYHRHSDIRCEMKRLYVCPEKQCQHLGEQLAVNIIEQARKAGYKEMVLDTIEPLQAAIHLYKKLGFEECEPYYDNPMDDVIYMRLDLHERKIKSENA